MLTERCIELNNELPDNICINLLDMSALPTYLEKLSNIWQGIIMPDLKPKAKATWLLGFIKYEIDEKPMYVIWFFLNDNFMTNQEIIKEIEQFIQNDTENGDDYES